MQVGMVGIGRMGANLVRRLMLGGHDTVAYDVESEAVDKLAAEGAVGVHSIADFAAARKAASGLGHGPGSVHRGNRRCGCRTLRAR